jgi:hypothetical protein
LRLASVCAVIRFPAGCRLSKAVATRRDDRAAFLAPPQWVLRLQAFGLIQRKRPRRSKTIQDEIGRERLPD